MSVATDTDWFGHRVDPGHNILYIAAEGGGGIGRRKDAWIRRNQEPKRDRSAVITTSVDLASQAFINWLGNEIRERAISLVVIDTLARAIPGAGESDAKDMGVVIENLYLLRDAWRTEGTTVLLVHHPARGSDTPRGSSRQEDDFDLLPSPHVLAGAGVDQLTGDRADACRPA
jgi:RecA-family ATPase